MLLGSGGNADLIYIVLLIPVMILSFWAQAQVSGNFKKYSQVRSSRGLTGRDAAEAVLRAHNVTGVGIRPCAGSLTDHYNPQDNCIYLSEPVYNVASVAAVGVACHEAGHAVQYALPSTVTSSQMIGSKASFFFLFLGLLISPALFLIGIVLFSFTTFFQVVTLPVEFDASNRAVKTIESSGLLNPEEIDGAKKVLKAAALTYVAALLTSAVQLLRYILIFMERTNRGRR